MKKRRTKRRSRATNPPVRPPFDNVVTIGEFVDFLLIVKQSDSVSIPDDFLFHFLKSLEFAVMRVAELFVETEGEMNHELYHYTFYQALRILMREVENLSQNADDIKPFQD